MRISCAAESRARSQVQQFTKFSQSNHKCYWINRSSDTDLPRFDSNSKWIQAVVKFKSRPDQTMFSCPFMLLYSDSTILKVSITQSQPQKRCVFVWIRYFDWFEKVCPPDPPSTPLSYQMVGCTPNGYHLPTPKFSANVISTQTSEPSPTPGRGMADFTCKKSYRTSY